MMEFMKAALPWIITGICLAICITLSAKRKKAQTDDHEVGNYGLLGMCLGMCAGLLICGAMEMSKGTGISLGMLWGFAIGFSIRKTTRDV